MFAVVSMGNMQACYVWGLGECDQVVELLANFWNGGGHAMNTCDM